MCADDLKLCYANYKIKKQANVGSTADKGAPFADLEIAMLEIEIRRRFRKTVDGISTSRI